MREFYATLQQEIDCLSSRNYELLGSRVLRFGEVLAVAGLGGCSDVDTRQNPDQVPEDLKKKKHADVRL